MHSFNSECLSKIIPKAGLLGWSVTLGQQAPSSATGPEQIVVTAQKRSENLQTVPISVAVLTSEELTRRGISSVASLMLGDVPSARVVPFAGNPTVLQVGIRGFINPDGSDITNENPVPVYVDDVYYGRQTSIALDLNDLERIEVLRGPQGTLFGKNAEGGAVRLISKAPSGALDINSSFEVGNYGYRKGAVHIDLPAIGGVATKIDLVGTDSNGWTTNPAPDQHNYGVTQSAGAELTLLFKPGDSLKFELAGDYTNLWSTEYWNAQLSHSATGSPYSAAWPIQSTTPSSEPWDTYRPLDPQAYWGTRFNADWAINDATSFRSISAFRVDESTLYNTSATSASVPGPFLLPPGVCPSAVIAYCNGIVTGPIPIFVISHRQYSQELQLTGKAGQWDWVAGLFYIHETGTENQITYFGTFLPNSIPSTFPYLPVTPTTSKVISPLFGPLGTAAADVTESSKAVFGQATFRPVGFDDQLSFTAGVRVSRDDKSATRPAAGGGVYLEPTYPAFVGGPVVPGLPCPRTPQCRPSIAETKTTPLAAIAYQWTPDLLSYFRFSTGYQAPGLNVGSQTFRYVAGSTVDAFELGVKSEFLNHTLRLNLASFYEEWKDPQETIQTASSSTVEFFSGPTIYISGVELDAAYAPMPGLTFNVNATGLHGGQAAATNPYPPPAGFPPVGASFQIVNLPSWGASFAGTYDVAHTDYGVWRGNVQVNGTASYYTAPDVTTPVKSYWLANARFGLAEIPVGSSGGKLEVMVWGDNLFNKSYNNFIYEIPGPNTDGAFGQPRTWGGSINYRFK